MVAPSASFTPPSMATFLPIVGFLSLAMVDCHLQEFSTILVGRLSHGKCNTAEPHYILW